MLKQLSERHARAGLRSHIEVRIEVHPVERLDNRKHTPDQRPRQVVPTSDTNDSHSTLGQLPRDRRNTLVSIFERVTGLNVARIENSRPRKSMWLRDPIAHDCFSKRSRTVGCTWMAPVHANAGVIRQPEQRDFAPR